MAEAMSTPTKSGSKVAKRMLSTPASPFSPGANFKRNNDKLEKQAKRKNLAQTLAGKALASSPYKSPRVVKATT